MRLWEISQSPLGAPAPYFVTTWEANPGDRAPRALGTPVFAASVELAKQSCPPGLIWNPPAIDRRQPRGIVAIGTDPPG